MPRNRDGIVWETTAEKDGIVRFLGIQEGITLTVLANGDRRIKKGPKGWNPEITIEDADTNKELDFHWLRSGAVLRVENGQKVEWDTVIATYEPTDFEIFSRGIAVERNDLKRENKVLRAKIRELQELVNEHN